jgi:D-alanyl-D-alanine carboxypeptidase/D-alanyl-D-alanine-endopeptidase (penicillin-binding protein 4)
MRLLVLILLPSVLFSSCSSISKRSLNKVLLATEKKFQDHTGFALYDLDKKKTVFEYNAAKYFTPASNAKIFTFFASLNVIGDSVPALRYVEQGDSLIFWGTGDPSFLYKYVYNNNRVYDFLKSSGKELYFSTSNFHTSHFGSGWAWDDYNSAYSAERSPLPLYGDIFSVAVRNRSVEVCPPYFKRFLTQGDMKEETEIVRQISANEFVFHPGEKYTDDEWDVPFHVDQQMITDLLSDTLNRTVQTVSLPVTPDTKWLYSIPSDSLYRVMMQDSDNFIAEQLLMMCAGVLTDSLQPEIAIKRVTTNFLGDLKDKPIWVDGSGLSRYNLFTPRSIVQLWEKIYQLVPRERLFTLLATGGKAGTIRNWYKADTPYIFGKTGSLSNNHCLSGYLVTKSGKTLIFSFMNSNYTTSTNEVRRNMQAVLSNLYEKY